MRRWPPLGFEFRVALRFLREGRFQSVLIVVGVAAGVAVVAYITALIGGLQRNTLEKTLGAQAHVVLTPIEETVAAARPRAAGEAAIADTQARAQRLRTLANWPGMVEVLERRPGVSAVSPMVAGAALARRGEATRSVSLAGVEIERFEPVVGLRAKLVAGTLRLAPGEAIVGNTLASDLGLRVGDRFVASTGTREESFRIVALVDLGVAEQNRRTVYVPLRSAQSLFDLAGGATRIDVSLDDVWAASALAAEWQRELPAKIESWQQTNAQLVSALNAQTVSTTIIRAVVMVVVVLGIASVLVVSVVQKQREIGILRATGATRAQVMGVFLVQGAVVGLLGALVGIGLAMAMIALFTRFVKGSDGLPLFAITLPAAVALQVALLAWAAGVLAAVAPARRAARMDPAQAIRL
jgi:lipoprotein-releasing system permease protein